MEAETENIKRRPKEPNVDQGTKPSNQNNETNNKTKAGRRPRRTAMPRRGLRSLAIAVALPISFHIAAVTLFHTAVHVASPQPPTGFRSVVLEAIFVGLPALMGFCAWLVWADGGFHRKPTALVFFLSYLVLSLAWDPIVFWLGFPWVGLAVSWAMLGALVGCHLIFKEVNPVAGDLVVVSMIWAVFVVIVNLNVLFG